MAKLIKVTAHPGYRLRLEYDDGVKGEADLSHLVGKGVFEAWNDPSVFESVTVGKHGEVRWSDAIELCGDAMYMQITEKSPEDLFPNLRASADAGT